MSQNSLQPNPTLSCLPFAYSPYANYKRESEKTNANDIIKNWLKQRHMGGQFCKHWQLCLLLPLRCRWSVYASNQVEEGGCYCENFWSVSRGQNVGSWAT